jgi:hypothetical protein
MHLEHGVADGIDAGDIKRQKRFKPLIRRKPNAQTVIRAEVGICGSTIRIEVLHIRVGDSAERGAEQSAAFEGLNHAATTGAKRSRNHAASSTVLV